MSIPIIPAFVINNGLRGVLGHEYINSQLILKLDFEGDTNTAINMNENKVLIANEIICQYLLRNNLLDVKAKLIQTSFDSSDKNKADKLQQLEEKFLSLEKDVYNLSIVTASTQKLVSDNTSIKSDSSTKIPPALELNTSVDIIKGSYKGAFGRVTKLHEQKVEVFISKENKTVTIYKTSVSPVIV